MILESITNMVRANIAARLNSAISSTTESSLGAASGAAGVKKPWVNPDKKSKFGTEVMVYPNEIGDKQQGHYIMFYISSFTQLPLKVTNRKKQFDEFRRKITSEQSNEFLSSKQINAVANQQVENFNNNILNKFGPAPSSAKGTAGRSIQAEKPRIETGTAIALYMPPSVQVSYDVKYTDQEVGTLAMLGKDAIDAFKGESGNLTAKLTAVKDKLGGGAKEGITNLLNASLDTLAPGARALQQIQSGKVITPRMEMMFEGVGRRSFTYTFAFIPKSADEARTIEKIIYTFKENMMPEYSNPTTRREMNIPNTFDITYMYQNQINGFINKISTCFLQKVDVQYGADRYTAYEPTSSMKGNGPPPQKSSITLSFVELETLSKEMIKEGY